MRPRVPRIVSRPATGARAIACALLVSLLAGPGCAHNAEKIVRKTTPAMIEESLGSLSDPDNQEMIRRLVDKIEVREAMAELAEVITQGVLDGLSDEERAAKLEAISEHFVSRLLEAVGEGIREQITPAARELISRSVADAVDEALGPRSRERAQAMAAGIARDAVTSLVHHAAVGVREELGPALASVIRDDLGPALEDAVVRRLIPAILKMLAEELKPLARELVGEVARETAKQMVLGVDDALVELEIIDPDQRRSFWGGVAVSFDRGLRLAEILAWFFAILAIILGVWLTRAVLRGRRLREQSDEDRRTLVDLLGRLRDRGHDDPWIDELVARAHEVTAKSDGGSKLGPERGKRG